MSRHSNSTIAILGLVDVFICISATLMESRDDHVRALNRMTQKMTRTVNTGKTIAVRDLSDTTFFINANGAIMLNSRPVTEEQLIDSLTRVAKTEMKPAGRAVHFFFGVDPESKHRYCSNIAAKLQAKGIIAEELTLPASPPEPGRS
jgi:biopolymer transport protein ExbD